MVHITPDTESVLVSRVAAYVQEYMSNYDASHDYQHILRVLGLSRCILDASPTEQYNQHLVTLSALLHDVGDRKYLLPGQDSSTLVEHILLDFGASPELAKDVQTIVMNVSYSSEIKHPEYVMEVISRYPELAVVQDADRLDAIGAVGVGRCFTFGGAMYGKARAQAADAGKRDLSNGRGLNETMQHFDDKLVRLEGMMKTAAGRDLARERTARLTEFMGWWDAEVTVEKTGLDVLAAM